MLNPVILFGAVAETKRLLKSIANKRFDFPQATKLVADSVPFTKCDLLDTTIVGFSHFTMNPQRNGVAITAVTKLLHL